MNNYLHYVQNSEHYGSVVKQADTLDLESSVERRVGSTPTRATIYIGEKPAHKLDLEVKALPPRPH